MQALSFGLIGCGNIARSAHLPAIARLADRVRLVATADANDAAAQVAAEPWGAQPYLDYRALLQRKDVEAVLVATPEYLHAEQIVAAAEAGKHVLCEKPMCRSLDEADLMLDACRRNGVLLLIGHSRRFTRRYMEVRQALEQDAIGAVRLLRENERRTSTHMVRMGQAGTRWTPQHWTGDPKLGGGVILSHGIHEIDLLRWFVGAEPVSVMAETGVTTPGNTGMPDFVSFVVRFANGAIGSAEISYALPASYPAFHLLELFGTKGAIRAHDHELVCCAEYDAYGVGFPGTYDVLLHDVTAYVRQLTEFVDAICQGRDARMPPTEARASLAVALAIGESARTGREISLRSEQRG